MSTFAKLPGRPLRKADLAALNGDRLQVVPYGGTAEDDEFHVYAVKMATGDSAHALGFDDSLERWRHLASVDAADLAAADQELDGVLDEWAVEIYSGRFEVLKSF